MGRPRQPVDLLLYKGKKNLTKAEIKERRETEVKASSEKVRPPRYLPKELRSEFNAIAKELLKIKIITNLDVDALARFVYAKKVYLQITDELLKRSPITLSLIDEEETVEEDGVVVRRLVEKSNQTYADLMLMQDKAFKQCRQSASDLGLTISSRCKLVIPKKEEKEKTTFEERFGEV